MHPSMKTEFQGFYKSVGHSNSEPLGLQCNIPDNWAVENYASLCVGQSVQFQSSGIPAHSWTVENYSSI